MSNTVAAITVSDLYVGAVFSTPVHVEDWTTVDDEGDDNGIIWTEAFRSDETPYVLIASNGRIKAVQIDDKLYEPWQYEILAEDSDGMAPISEYEFEALFEIDTDGVSGPQMNYWYPVDIEADAAAVKLLPLSLCHVEVDGQNGIALTGGGMDMTWSICAAFMVLGYLPPLHFARDLTASGDTLTDSDDVIVAACLASMDHAVASIQRDRGLIVQRFTRH